MSAQLSRPGVEITQQFRTTTPAVVTPTLASVIVGAAKQTVSVVNRTATGAPELNDQSVVSLPASFIAKPGTGSPIAYTGLTGLHLILSANGGDDIDIEFDNNTISPAAMASFIQDQLLALGVSGLLAERYGDDSFRIVSVGRGQFESIEIRPGTSPAVLTAFDTVIGYAYRGTDQYEQSDLVVPLPDFPDPNANLDELVVEPATVRVFLRSGVGLNLAEASKSEAFLRRGGGGAAAALVGTVAVATGGLYGGGTLNGTTLTIALDGGTPVDVVFSSPANGAAVRDAVNTAMGFPFLSSAGTYFQVVSPTLGELSSIVLTGGAAALLGFVGANATSVGVSSVSAPTQGQGQITSLVAVLGQDFTAAGTAATCTGARDISGLTYPGDLTGEDLTMSVRGGAPQTLVFPNTIASQANLLSAIGAFFPGITATVVSTKLVLTDNVGGGTDSGFRILGGSACEVLGLVPSVLGRWSLATIGPDLTALNTRKLRIAFPLGTYEATFSGFTNGSVPADVATFLNALPSFSALGVASIESGALRIRGLNGGTALGVPHTLTVLAATSLDAAQLLGLSRYDSATFHHFEGAPNPPKAGDDLYVDGSLLGRIQKVAPNGVVDRVRIDKQISVSADTGNLFHIRARGLSANTAGRPDPELVVDGSGQPALKQDILRDAFGAPGTSKAFVHIGYRALRLDVTPKAKNPGLLTIGSTTELEAILDVSSDNPLGLGIYLALLNAPGATISGLGIDAVAPDAPFGTIEAFTRAAEFLEAYEVYTLAPLTHDPVVGQIYSGHVTAMSEPAQKSERIVVFNHEQPTRRLDTPVATGLNGNSVGSLGTQFDTGISNLTALIQNGGVNPVGTIPVESGLFLDIGSDAKRYSIANVSGSIVTIRILFTAEQNADAFYSVGDLNDAPLPSSLIDEPFAIRVRGAELVRADGLPDKQGMAETYQQLGVAIGNRRFINIVADKVVVTLGGVDQIVEGFYGCAVRAGMIAGKPPQQSFTNFPQAGIKQVKGTNGYFSEKQLNIIAGGGNDILVQDVANGPITSRFALTTDMTSLETRTDSTTRVVDFAAKFIRRALRTYIGRYNITSGFIDTISNVFQGLVEYLVNEGVILGGALKSIIQDEDDLDAIFAECTLDPPRPCNFIRVVLAI